MDYRLKALLPDFVKHYLAAAAWTTVEDSRTENSDFTAEAKRMAELHCAMFFGAVVVAYGREGAVKILQTKSNDGGLQAAHDFWLTRCGHGTGFWDREEIYGEDVAQKLSEISSILDNVDCDHIRGPKSKLTFI